jgi:AcrR family transcriptional regulator
MRGVVSENARLGVRVPAQTRAQATLDRIVAATRRLLRDRRFEQITIAEIVAEADTSTGSFYARFGSKEALLPYLYEAYNAETAAATATLDRDGVLNALTLRQAVTALIRVLRSGPLKMDGLVRAMTLYARSHPERLPETAYTRTRRFFDMMSALFKPHLNGADAEKRSCVAAFAAATLLREHRFFPDAPLARTLALTHDEFAVEVEKMTAAYLEGTAARPNARAKTKGKVGRNNAARNLTP